MRAIDLMDQDLILTIRSKSLNLITQWDIKPKIKVRHLIILHEQIEELREESKSIKILSRESEEHQQEKGHKFRDKFAHENLEIFHH